MPYRFQFENCRIRPMPHAAPYPATRLALAFRSCSCRQKAKTGAGTVAGTGDGAGDGAGVGLVSWPTAVGLISRTNRTRVCCKSESSFCYVTKAQHLTMSLTHTDKLTHSPGAWGLGARERDNKLAEHSYLTFPLSR